MCQPSFQHDGNVSSTEVKYRQRFLLGHRTRLILTHFQVHLSPIRCRPLLPSRYQEMARLGTLRIETAALTARAEAALHSTAGRTPASARRGGRPVTAGVTSRGPGVGLLPPAGAARPRREEG